MFCQESSGSSGQEGFIGSVGGLGIAALAILCSTLFATRPRERRGPAWAGSPYALLKTMFEEHCGTAANS